MDIHISPEIIKGFITLLVLLAIMLAWVKLKGRSIANAFIALAFVLMFFGLYSIIEKIWK